MSSSIGNVLQGLISALTITNVALEPGASLQTRRGAVRAIHRAIRKTAETDELWNDLTWRATTLPADTATTQALLLAIGDLLTERQAALLVMTGYRTPPPPPAFALIEETRNAINGSDGGSIYSGQHLEVSRAALRSFVEQLESHLPSADSRSLNRLLHYARRAGVLAAILAVAASIQVKTGNEFDINLGISQKDLLVVEVTVPKPWGDSESVKSLINQASTGKLNEIMASIEADMLDLTSTGEQGREQFNRDLRRGSTRNESGQLRRSGLPDERRSDDDLSKSRDESMRRQLEALARDHGSAFSVVRISDTGDENVIYLEGFMGEEVLRRQDDDVEAYRIRFDQLAELSDRIINRPADDENQGS